MTALKRKQIIEQAIRTIGRRGFSGFSLQELAAACGLTNAGLLYHFPSKEKLLVELLDESQRRDAEAIAAALRLADPDAADPAAILRAIVAQTAAEPELARLYAVLQAESLDVTHPAHEIFLARERSTLEKFRQLVAGQVADPLATARELLALMVGLEQQWLRANMGFDFVEAWDHGAARLLQRAAGAA
jgi:AcrR family transcriptional regulator